MNKSFLPALAFATLVAGTANAQLTLSWSDEFDGAANTLPDANKWKIEVVSNPANNEAQYYSNRTKNVSLNGSGFLEITGYKEAMGGKQYTSGRLNTSGKFQQTYGRWEARIKLPAGTGFWPAFWMLGNNNGCGGWPSCGEIDIMENRGRLPRTSSSAMHGPGYSGNTPLSKGYNLPTGAPTYFEDFHLFAAEWTEGWVKFYVDGSLYYTVNKADVTKYGNWVYNHPFYTILNLAIGGAFDGNQLPPESAFPAKMVVDYVRAYTGVSTALFGTPGRRALAALDPATASVFDMAGRKLSGGPGERAPASLLLLKAEDGRAATLLHVEP